MIRISAIAPMPGREVAEVKSTALVVCQSPTSDKTTRQGAQVCTSSPGVEAVGTAVKVTGPSELRERRARRKLAFMELVWNKVRGGMSQKLAAEAVSLEHDWSDLTRGGKSLISPKSALRNFRHWRRRIGNAQDKSPNFENWRELIEAYDGAREYIRPGSDSFWIKFKQLYENRNEPSMAQAYKIAAIMAANDPQCVIPSYGQVDHYYTHHVNRAAVELARKGEEHARLRLIGFHHREAPPVNSVWFSDHHQFDAAIRVWDATTQNWKAVRPWLTTWMDWGSLYLVGFVIRAIPPNRDVVERSLRIAIRNRGNVTPQHIYIDNGKDYKALGFARHSDDDRKRISTVCDLLGINATFAIPYNAKAKVVERIFGIVCGNFSRFWKSYRGSTPAQRPETADVEWEHPERLPTLEQFTAAFTKWIEADYHRSKSSGKILDGKSPLEAITAAPKLRNPVPEDVLTRAFLRSVGVRQIRGGGEVEVGKTIFRSDALYQYMAKSKEVIVKIDPDDVMSAHAFTSNLQYLGPLTRVRMVPGLATDPIAIEQMREETKAQNRRLRELKAVQRAGLSASQGASIGGAYYLPAECQVIAKRIEHEESAVSQAERAELADMEAMLREQTAVNQQQIFEGSDADFSAQDAADLAAIEAENLSTEEHS